MKTNIVQRALEAQSAASEQEQIAKAQRIIGQIANAQKQIGALNASIADWRKELKDMDFNPPTAAEVLGD